MINWLTAPRGALTLSGAALLAFIAYSFLVSRYILEELLPGVLPALLETAVVLAISGFWVWGLVSASGGAARGWIILLVCSLLPTLFTLYDLVRYSPIPQGWPLLQIVVWITFISSAAANAAVVVQIRK